MYTSASPLVGTYPSSFRFLLRNDLNENPATGNPYNARTTLHGLPWYAIGNSSPAITQYFSVIGAVKYAFCISADKTSKSFNAAIRKNILIESRVGTVEYVDSFATSGTLCPSATSLAFLWRVIFTSKTI